MLGTKMAINSKFYLICDLFFIFNSKLGNYRNLKIKIPSVLLSGICKLKIQITNSSKTCMCYFSFTW